MAVVTLRIDLGPYVPVEDLSELVANIGTACSFGSALQRLSDRNDALYQVLRTQSPFSRDPGEAFAVFSTRYEQIHSLGQPAAFLPSPRLERAVSEQLQEMDAAARAEVRVERLRYENPLELVIAATGVAVLAVLRLIRDWSTDRRIGAARALEYESAARVNDRVRRIAIEELASGRLRLSQEQILPLLTPNVVRTIRSLGDAPLVIEGVGEEIAKGEPAS